MTTLTHDFEAPAGDAVAITAANSGGTGRTAFDVVSATAGQTLEVDTAIVKHGTQSGAFATAATAGQSYVAWTGLAGVATVWLRVYLYLTALPTTAMHAFFRPYSSTTSRLQLGPFLSGSETKIRLLDAAAATVTTLAATIPLTTWVRLEGRFDMSASALWELRYFADPDATVATETLSGSAANFGGTATEYRIGAPSTQANNVLRHLDAIELNDTGFPGPFSVIAETRSGTSNRGLMFHRRPRRRRHYA